MALPGTVTDQLTAEEFFEEYGDARCELIDGEVTEMAPAGGEHGDVELGILAAIRVVTQRHRLGWAFGPSTGFLVDRAPDTVLQPDGSFVAAGRLSHAPPGFVELAPDLVLEVISPSDRMSAVIAKVNRWLAAGVQVVWVADPAAAEVLVWRSPSEVQTVGRDETLTCEELLPGFALPLSEVFHRGE